jgi:hypothetical protein
MTLLAMGSWSLYYRYIERRGREEARRLSGGIFPRHKSEIAIVLGYPFRVRISQ